MSKRLQVILADDEADQLREFARGEGLTVSEWVRQVLRQARNEKPSVDRATKFAALNAAMRHSFPVGPIEEVLEEIERGYHPG